MMASVSEEIFSAVPGVAVSVCREDGGWLKPLGAKEDLGVCCLSSQCDLVVLQGLVQGYWVLFPHPNWAVLGRAALSFQWVLFYRASCNQAWAILGRTSLPCWYLLGEKYLH